MAVTPYVTYPGTCEEAFVFYAKVMGGELKELNHFRGSIAEAMAPEGELDRVMNASLLIGGSLILGADIGPDEYRPPAGFSLTYSTDDVEEARGVFSALAEGGVVHTPFAAPSLPVAGTLAGAESADGVLGRGVVVDRFAVPWTVTCE